MQIKLVVDQIRRENPKSRILVLIPSYYMGAETPNHVTDYREMNRKSQQDEVTRNLKFDVSRGYDFKFQRIIAEFKSRRMLYVLPSGIDDDLFLIIASLNSGNRKGYVVTNDLMRNHKMKLEFGALLKWKNSQTVPFFLGGTERAPFVRLWAPGNYLLLYQHMIRLPNYCFNFFLGPTRREIQSNGKGTIHIPSVNDDSWLCVNFRNNIAKNNK